MFDHKHYVPLLKGKDAEYRSLGDMDGKTKLRLTPLIEIPPIDWDFQNECPAKTLDDHLKKVPDRMATSWGRDRPLFVDLQYVADAGNLSNGQHPVEHLFDAMAQKGVKAIPVTSPTRNVAFQQAVSAVTQRHGLGLCLRIVDDEFPEDIQADLQSQIDELLTMLNVPIGQVDLIIDLESMDSDKRRVYQMLATTLLHALPAISQFRTLTLAGSGFPENLSGCPRNSATLLTRAEWLVWKGLAARHKALPRMPTFGDYAVAAPGYPEHDIDPKVMRMSVNLRYTVDDEWLVMKAADAKLFGFEQFVDLCRDLAARPEYKGPPFSWGDTYIDACVRGADGPGSATTWRRVATTHHLAFVVQQLASFVWP